MFRSRDLAQARNDFNLGPSEVLGPLVDAKGAPSRHKVFPPTSCPAEIPPTTSRATALSSWNPAAWETEVLAYLKDCGER